MRVETQRNLSDVRIIEASRVLVADRFGNPLMVAVETSPDIIYVKHVREKGFKEMLQILGIDRTVIVADLEPKLVSNA